MKRLFSIALCLLIFIPAFSATMEEALTRLSAIETLKDEMIKSNDGESLSDEEMEALDLLYEVLEGDEYTASSLNGNFDFSVSEYNLDKTLWNAQAEGMLFNQINLSRSIDILYSDAMNKSYVPESEMTDYQRRDYEYYIDNYENRLLSGEKVFFAEFTFRLTHWEGPNQYRLEGVTLKIYKEPSHPREILSFDETAMKECFTFVERDRATIDGKEFRSPEQIEQNKLRIAEILEKEVIEEQAKPSSDAGQGNNSPSWEQKRRRAFYISFDIKPENISTMNPNNVLGNAYGTLTFGIGRFLFAGIIAGLDLGEIQGGAIYSFGVNIGANVTIANFIRPYVETSISALTNNKSLVKLGGGCDIILSHFMITIGINYNWENNFDGSNEGRDNYTKVFLGAGFAW